MLATSNFLVPNATFVVELVAFLLTLAVLAKYVLPVINKTGVTLDHVNTELDKIDVMTDSAVDAVSAIDRAVRAVSAIVTAPIEALAGLAAAFRHGVSSLVANRDVNEAVRTAKEAGTRRMNDLADDLEAANRPGGSSSGMR